jgi:hypothetical protein
VGSESLKCNPNTDFSFGRLGAFLSRLLGDPDLDNAQEREIKSPEPMGESARAAGSGKAEEEWAKVR